MREMDFRIKDKDGRTICPNCGKAYFPELGERKEPGKLIQDEFPNSKPYQREQLLSGLCSDNCWADYLGVRE
jgi:uncharacterized Zn finger protein (UPF0148 family)